MWIFGTLELISLIAAVATFCAIGVSLWLSLKAKTIKFKVFVKSEINAVIIINTGDSRFIINGFGLKNGKDYYMNLNQQYSKILSVPIKSFNNSTTTQLISVGQVLVEQGDFIETGLRSIDQNIISKKTKLFLVVNCKIHTFKLQFKKYKLIINNKNNDEYKKYTKKEAMYFGKYTGI